jgi:streptogramin lyase
MNANERIDARLAELMHDLAGSALEPLDEVLRQTAGARQRPAWTFPERWIPVTDITARPFMQPNRSVLLATLALLILAALAVVAAGIWQRPTVPLVTNLDIDASAAQRLEIEAAVIPATGLGKLWLIIGGAGVAQVDPATGEVLELTQIDAGACGFLESAFDRIWTPTCAIGGVASIAVDGASVHIPIGMAATDEEATIGVDADALWLVAGGLGDQLVRVDPVLGQVVATFPVATGSASPEPGFGSIWVAAKATGQVVRIDPATGTTQATIPVGNQPRHLAVSEDAVWALNQMDGTVSRIDPKSNLVVATIPVGDLANAPDIEVAGGSVWVRGKDLVTRIDPAANSVVQTYGPAPGVGAIAADGDSVWVTAPDVGLVWRIPVGEVEGGR